MHRSLRAAHHHLHRATITAAQRLRHDDGQATTEYALILLAAAMVALLAIGWATSGGGAGKIGSLFDRVIDAVLGNL